MDLETLRRLNTQTMIRGRHQRFRQLQRLAERPTAATSDSASLAQLRGSIEQSHREYELRRAARPQVNFDPTLPIAEHAQTIADLVSAHQVVVVTGETGSGKSTQLPLVLLAAGLGIDGWIGHTQPRRIAARSIAARIASQLNSPLGQQAGYQVRFEEVLRPEAYIKLMTDGILLAESQGDRFLNRYSAIIVDEAHERSMNIDFLLGRLFQLVPQRPELRIVITSATIDAQKFADHFAQQLAAVPIVEVSGRTYPVEIRYQPPARDDANRPPGDEDNQLSAIGQLISEGPGDILVFQPTEYEIRSLARRLRGWLTAHRMAGVEVVPLYARLTPAQQNTVFAPHRGRRIVVATNVAESSITVPGIRYVVDTGTARISRYAPRSKVQRLPIEPISQASADQRAGRCGRIGPGICVRLYDQADYESRPRYTTPEIRRSNLASVILQTIALSLGDVETFPFMDPPAREAIRDGYDTLFELHAIDEERRLTELGRQLSLFPTDPRVARILLAGGELGCLHEVAIIAAGLEIPDPRLRPAERQQEADQRHAQWLDPRSDFLALLNVYDSFQRLKAKLSRSRLERACQDQFLSLNYLRQWSDVHRQLIEIAREQRLQLNRRRDDYDSIHQALLTGLISGVGMQTERGEFLGAKEVRFQLWPGSGLKHKPPKWLMAAEIVETSRRYGRTAAAIQPRWLESIAAHLLTYHYSDPQWSEPAQRCVAAERITLYGLTLSTKRSVAYGHLDPELSRQLLIQEGLLAGRISSRQEFFVANQQLRTAAAEWATKTRDRSWIVDDWNLQRFYNARLPTEAIDGPSLNRCLRQSPELADRLTLTWSDLVPDAQLPQPSQFPFRLDIGASQLPLRYEFHPGADDDGITVEIPRAVLGQVSQQQLDWLVPGRQIDLISELIRSLPKSLRRQLIPANETARRVAEHVPFGHGNLFAAVADQLSRIAEARIRPEDFRQEKIPADLRFHLVVVDDEGHTLATGRDLPSIQQSLGVSSTETSSIRDESQSSEWHRDGLTTWNFGDLPESVEARRGSAVLTLYPTLIDNETQVGLRLVDSPQVADWHRRQGMTRLIALDQHRSIRSQLKWLPALESATIAVTPWVGSESFRAKVGDLLAALAADGLSDIRTQAGFDQALARQVPGLLAAATQDVAIWLEGLATHLKPLRLQIETNQVSSLKPVCDDVRRQLQALFDEYFPLQIPWVWLQQFPRYIAAMAARLDKASTQIGRDREMEQSIESLLQRWSAANERSVPRYPIHPRLVELRWMIEELRVSLFAQQLGTRVPVSIKRIEKRFEPEAGRRP